MELSTPWVDLPLPGALPDAARARDPEAARRVSEEFEAFFVAQMMEEMFAGVEPDGLFGGGIAEGPLRSLLFQEYGKSIARTRSIGIADMVQREILKLQEVEQP